MKSNSESRRLSRRRVVAGLASLPLLAEPMVALAGVGGGQTAMPVADFDETTWAQLQKNGARPAAYVFTTTYCSTCPLAFERLHAFMVAAHKKAELVAVVMDAQGDRALVHARHYVGVTRFYAFDGFEPAIRQSVDPKWPNVTPYVVLLGRNGPVQRCIGPPDPAMMKRWLA